MSKEIIPHEILESKILLIRKHKVLLDRDLAALYQVETRVLNQAVRRNLDRFPEDFIFKLTRDEIRDLSQFVISPGLKHAPNVFAFTEQGVAMLSGVLHSKRAIAVNIAIMRTFVKLRGLLAEHVDLRRKLEEMEKKYDYQFKVVFDAIKSLIAEPPPVKKIGFTAKIQGHNL
ncbi:MAG: ORF6N domain-containing protein [Elusimicrobiales bacterium]|nr:ORF6N domain-containing protein [Elusimicrobiales bacterium]